MSSWANRQLPRKRDISQIPEHLRPQIIPRVERPEVRISESFIPRQDVLNNTIIDRSNKNIVAKVLSEPINNNRQYIPKRIDSQPGPGAFELTYKNKSYIFIILRNLRNVRDNDLWISSYNSIRRIYTNKIVIIDDNSSINTVDGKLFNAEVLKSEFNGAGELLPYYYFLKYKWADNMIFLHDSMFLNRPFRDTELDSEIKFHWYFAKNDVEDYKKINNYVSLLKNNNEFKLYINNKESIWQGCFGGAVVTSYDIIKTLEEKYEIFSNLVFAIKTRKDRETFERIIGALLHFEKLVDNTSSSNFGDILRYPDAFESFNNNMETGLHIVKQRNYDTAIIKVWRGR